MSLPKELLERGAALGIDFEAIAGQEPGEVASFLTEIEKAAADADGDGDAEADDEEARSIVKHLVDLLGSAIAGLKSRNVQKDEAGDGDDEESDKDPESDPEVVALRESLEATQKELEDERTELRVAKAMGEVEAAVKDRRMTPATAEALGPVVKHLAETDVAHVAKSDDGKDVETSMAALVVKAASHDREVLASLFETAGSAGAGDENEPELWQHLKKKQAVGAGNGDGQGDN